MFRGLGSNIGHGLFVGWVEQPDIFCWVSFLNPTYVPAIWLLLAKPNKMTADRTILKKTIKGSLSAGKHWTVRDLYGKTDR